MRTTVPKVMCVGVGLVMAVAVAGCSSSSKTPKATPTTASSTGASTPSGTPIKVGEICSCSGAAGFSSSTAPSPAAIRAWADAANAAGGIDGHRVQVISYNDGTNPGTSLTDAQHLISDHVVAIVDDTTLVSSWASAAEAAHVPVVGTFTINPPFTTSSDFFAEGQTNDTTLQAIIQVAKTAGAKSIGNLYCAEAPVCAESTSYVESAGKAAGVPDLYNASISATAPNYTAQCLTAKQKGVQSLFIGDAPAVVEHVASDCATQDYDPIYAIEGAGFEMSETSAGALSKNMWLQFPDIPFFDTSVPAVQTFDHVMDKYAPGIRENGTEFIEDNFMTYISGKLIEAGIEAGGLTATATPTAAEVIAGLTTMKGETLGGLTPPLTFKAGQANPQPCYFTARILNGKAEMANNGQPSCISLPSS